MPRDLPVADAASAESDSGCLPRGYRLRDFVIEQVLAEGGFGVVYSAIDLRLQRRVAIKEYMPAAYARRAGDLSVQPRSSAPQQDGFAVGLRSFINEARLLAGFDHPTLARVLQFWEDKGTGYIVMPLYQAPTVRQWTLARAQAPDAAWLRAFLDRMLEALALVHGVSCVHRDISPDNILLQRDADPLLLDFGAARRVLEKLTQTLTVILKPGYAPVEQYAHSAGLRQGPWTDLYALCATAHFVLTRQSPPPAVARMMQDEYQPLAQRLAGRYPPALLHALDAGLQVRPADRPQSVAEFRALLAASPYAPVASAPEASAPAMPEATTTAQPVAVEPMPLDAFSAEPSMAVTTFVSAEPVADATPTCAPTPARRPRAPTPRMLPAAVFGLLAALGGAWLWSLRPAPDVPVAVAHVALPADVPVPVAVPEPEPASAVETEADSTASALAWREGQSAPDSTTDAPAVEPAAATAPVATAALAQSRAASGTAAPSRPAAAQPRAAADTRVTTTATATPAAPRATPAALVDRASVAMPVTPPPPAQTSRDATDSPLADAAPAQARAPAADAPAVEPLRALDRPQPVFPVQAARDGIESGRVVARLHVAADGRVRRVQVIESSPRRVFDRAVLAAARQWRYAAPGEPRQVDIEFLFALGG